MKAGLFLAICMFGAFAAGIAFGRGWYALAAVNGFFALLSLVVVIHARYTRE